MIEKISPDCNIFKVTAVHVVDSTTDYAVFDLQLSGALWARKRLTNKSERRHDKLFAFFEKNNQSLNQLLNKYVSFDVDVKNNLLSIGRIHSLDVLDDFEDLLVEYDRKPFSTPMQVYEFLTKRGRDVNPNGSITLGPPYDYIDVVSKYGLSVCYYNEVYPGTLNLSNIEMIFKEFYEGKYIDTCNYDLDSVYELRTTAIVEYRRKFYKDKTGVESVSEIKVLELGDSLNVEQIRFLAEVNR